MNTTPRTRRARAVRRITAVLFALLAVGLLSGCGSQASPQDRSTAALHVDPALHRELPAGVRARGVLRIATDASYAPASSFGPDGRTIVGFEPDLGTALGQVLGVKVRFSNADFATILPTVAKHRVDVAMSAITDTPARERTVDFVNYFTAGTSIVVQRGNPAGITDLAGLCGHTVAVEKGTTQVDLLSRAQGQCAGARMHVKTYPTNDDALVQLRTGRVNAVLNDYPPAAYLASDRATRARYQLASTTQYEPGLYGIAVAKDRPRLRDALEAALGRVMGAGRYERVLRRWGVADGAVRSPSVNGGGTSAGAAA